MSDDPSFLDKLSEPCPHEPGTRIELTSMVDDPDPLPAGSQGTVTGGNGAQLYVKWDNGRSLMLLPGFDRWKVLP